MSGADLPKLKFFLATFVPSGKVFEDVNEDEDFEGKR